MSVAYQFEPDARVEYHEAIRYYAMESRDAGVASRFVTAVESAVETICAAPALWRVVEPPDVRRYVLRRFPFVLYYRYQRAEELIRILAIMHASRQPGYWRKRLPPSP